MLNFILYNYSNISKITCFGSCIQNLFRWKVLKVFVTFNYSWRHWTCLLQQFSQLMVEWCELFDSFEARSFYYTMPCHWYQFSVLGQFIPCGVAHSVSCSETIRSTSRQEYNACKYLDSLLRAISCPTERHLISPRWAEDGLRHRVESHGGTDNVFASCSTVQLQSYSNTAAMSAVRDFNQPEEQTQACSKLRLERAMLDFQQENVI